MKIVVMKQRAWIMKGLFIIIISFVSLFSFAQDPTDSLPGDPGAFSVYTIQNLSFGLVDLSFQLGYIVAHFINSKAKFFYLAVVFVNLLFSLVNRLACALGGVP